MTHPYICFWMITYVNAFSTNLVCALYSVDLVWDYSLAKFCQLFTDLSARGMIIVGYYCFLFFIIAFNWSFSSLIFKFKIKSLNFTLF